MKISLFTKSYFIKTISVFIVVFITFASPKGVNAFSFSDLISSITGSKIQAAENEVTPENLDDYGSDDYSSSSNMKLFGADSVAPDKKSLDDCPELNIDDGALQMDTNCGIGKGIESDSTGEMNAYIVAEGDTLSEIASRFDVSVNTIKWENNLTGQTLKVGQKLNILPVTGVRHIIKKGDTLEKIALKYDADLNDVKIFNGVDRSDLLKTGENLYIPNGKPVTIIVVKPIIKNNTHVVSTGSVDKSDSGYYIRPAQGRITSPYGSRRRGFHYGVDIGNARGTTIVAAASGTIVEVLGVCREGKSSCGGRYGNFIVIEHLNGTRTRYAHLSKVTVSIGEQVGQGEQIGTIGNTGRSTGPHLHFQIEKSNGSTINPRF